MAKKIILFILLLIPFIGIGQGKKDTIPVVMLVCDTSKVIHIGWEYFEEDTAATRKYADTTKSKFFVIVGKWKKDTTWGEPNKNIYWQFGYEVRQRHKDYYYVDGRIEDYFTHVEYLDENKKQLSKNIIVWQHKNR